MRLDFWKFWTGETISAFGTSVTQFAMPLIVFKLTGWHVSGLAWPLLLPDPAALIVAGSVLAACLVALGFLDNAKKKGHVV